MTIICKFFFNFIKKKKYGNLQYDNYLKKKIKFKFQNIRKKMEQELPPGWVFGVKLGLTGTDQD